MHFLINNHNQLALTLSRFDTLSEVLILLGMCTQLQEGVWQHTTPNRQELCKRLSVSEIGFKVTLRTLLKKNLILKHKRGSYKINL